MAKYLKIEYLVAADGKVTERVLNGSGNDCLETTAVVEMVMGEVENRQLLPEFVNHPEPAIVQPNLHISHHYKT